MLTRCSPKDLPTLQRRGAYSSGVACTRLGYAFKIATETLSSPSREPHFKICRVGERSRCNRRHFFCVTVRTIAGRRSRVGAECCIDASCSYELWARNWLLLTPGTALLGESQAQGSLAADTNASPHVSTTSGWCRVQASAQGKGSGQGRLNPATKQQKVIGQLPISIPSLYVAM